MATLIIDPIPEPLFEKLRMAAAAHNLSLAEEARAILERGLPGGTDDAARKLEAIRELRRPLEGKITPLSDEILAQARAERRS